MKNPGRAPLAPDPPAPEESRLYNGLNYPVFIHEKIIEDITRAPELRRRLSLTLQRLASRDRQAWSRAAPRPIAAGDAARWAAPEACRHTSGGRLVDARRGANVMRYKPAVVDLFCGAGGLSYGMTLAGLDVVAGIDIDPACKHPFEFNVGSDFHEKDVSQVKPKWVSSLYPPDSVKILAGCAPCQPFSTYAQRYAEQDGSWELLSKFSSLIEDIRPEIVTMEIVPSLKKHPNFEDFLKTLEDSGYGCPYYDVVACAGYGVPQTRRRLALLASSLGEIELISPTHSRNRYPTVRDFIGDQEEITVGAASSDDPLHRCSRMSDTNLERIRHSQPSGTWHDWPEDLRAACHTVESGQTYTGVYGRMRWDAPGPTITTQFNGFGNGRFGHPGQDRAISLREGALLQTFPPE